MTTNTQRDAEVTNIKLLTYAAMATLKIVMLAVLQYNTTQRNTATIKTTTGATIMITTTTTKY